LIADVLNLKRLTRDLPEPFHGWYDPRRYETAQDYLRVNTRFRWAAAAVDIFLFLGLWFCKGFPLIDSWVRSVSDHPVGSGLLYIGLLVVLKWVVSLPFYVYSTFVIGLGSTKPPGKCLCPTWQNRPFWVLSLGAH
jgi:STE24 endopeptidase